MNIKQVLIIRKDLKMRRGKECSQASHGAMAFLTQRLQKQRATGQPIKDLFNSVEWEWINGIFAKVCCQVQSEAELRELHEKAQTAGLEAHLVTDCGLTEFGGVPTVTALAIGPDLSEKIDPVTRHLALY